MNKFWLFGCGLNGCQAYRQIGAEYIRGFIDNKKCGETYFGETVLSLEDARPLLEKEKDIVLITPDSDAAISISKQLAQKNVNGFLFWIMVKENVQFYLNLIQKSESDILMQQMRDQVKIYADMLQKKEQQIAYILEHVSPESIKPANGKLREQQLAMVKFAHDFFEPLEKEGIHPILSAGNLLGYVRHDGFIPWDDDLDFKLLRSEYDALLQYCKEHYASYKYLGTSVWADGGKEYINWIDKVTRNHLKEYVLVEHPAHIWILYRVREDCLLWMDVFSIDMYQEGVDWKLHRRKLDGFGAKVKEMQNCAEVYKLIKHEMEEDKKTWDENGSNLFYGLDNEESYEYYIRNEGFLKREYVLPLSKAIWEGYEFYIPNNPEECCRYVFGDDYRKLPSNFGAQVHGG